MRTNSRSCSKSCWASISSRFTIARIRRWLDLQSPSNLLTSDTSLLDASIETHMCTMFSSFCDKTRKSRHVHSEWHFEQLTSKGSCSCLPLHVLHFLKFQKPGGAMGKDELVISDLHRHMGSLRSGCWPGERWLSQLEMIESTQAFVKQCRGLHQVDQISWW